MAKDPAFLFYPGDFNTGTQFFTDEQVGKYIRLLMAQHQHGHLSEQQVLHICKTYDNHIMAKFIKDDNGLWYNERLANEIVRRKDYSKSRSKNRSSKKNISKTYVKHMETKNETKTKDLNLTTNYIVVDNEMILDALPLLEYYEVQLNGMQKENGNVAWGPMVPKWFTEHLQEEFTDGMHVKNSFKKFYMFSKAKPKKSLKPLHDLK